MTNSNQEEIDALEGQDLTQLIKQGSDPNLIIRSPEGEPMSTYAVRLPATVIDRVSVVAKARGSATGTVMREWIIERLVVEEARPVEDDTALWTASIGAALAAVPEIAQRTAESLRHSA